MAGGVSYGIVLNVKTGDPALGWAGGDEVEPGAAVGAPCCDETSAALELLACIGNEAVITEAAFDGKDVKLKGATGSVTGKGHGRVSCHFPRKVLERLVAGDRVQIRTQGLGLRFSPGGKSVTSDPQLLERILGNLIQNAIKYTEEGGVVVVARTTEESLNLEVWDTGIGIKSSDLPRIFAEFYQVGQSERSRTQGLGMGLAIVKRLAHLLGYRLMVASRPGRGTMFRLSVPLGGLPEIPEFTTAADTVPMPVMEPRSVLVIDDEESIRLGLQLLLEEWGYETIIAATAGEAADAVRARAMPPDLILSDLHLGDGPDGIAAIRAVRELCALQVPAILVTGDTSREELRRATESGHTVLFKPLQPRKLFNALRGMVS